MLLNIEKSEEQDKERSKPFRKQALIFTCLHYKAFENTVGKGQIIHNEQLTLFGELFAIFFEYEIVYANSFSLEESKICRLGED